MWFKSNLTTPAVAAISFYLIGGTIPAPAYADTGDQLFKLLATDGAEGDQFGVKVAISGATAIVGADRDDDNGPDSGSAYLFDATTGLQLYKLLPNDGAEGDRFGGAVAISGATAIVGAYNDADNGENSGSAYVFDITTGQQLFKLLPTDGALDDEFGRSVQISGTTAIVGAFNHDDNGSQSGSAYLFDTTTGLQLFKLLPEDGTANDRFGFTVAISGTTAIVGAYFDADNGSGSGSAYLFDTTTGRQLFKLLPNDGQPDGRFGVSVAINGATALVGADRDDSEGFNAGSAYLFDTNTGLQLFKLVPNDSGVSDRFGVSVEVSHNTAVVGSNRNDDNGSTSGSAYFFNITNGRQIIKLLPDDGAAGDEFGRCVGIWGTTAIVGAYFHDDNGANSGSAYLFDAIPPPTCPWDLDGDGSVGGSDLLALLVSWGPCPPKGDCPADFDGNGFVGGAADILLLLVNWGPCP